MLLELERVGPLERVMRGSLEMRNRIGASRGLWRRNVGLHWLSHLGLATKSRVWQTRHLDRASCLFASRTCRLHGEWPKKRRLASGCLLVSEAHALYAGATVAGASCALCSPFADCSLQFAVLSSQTFEFAIWCSVLLLVCVCVSLAIQNSAPEEQEFSRQLLKLLKFVDSLIKWPSWSS